MRDSIITSSSIDAATRKALFTALKNPAVLDRFLSSLREVRLQALVALREPVVSRDTALESSDEQDKNKITPRNQYLAAESMLLAAKKGVSPDEQAEHLIHFLENALEHAEGRPRTHSRRSFLQKTLAYRPEKKPDSVRVALKHLHRDASDAPKVDEPQDGVGRRDLLKQAGMGAVVGYAAGGAAGGLVRPLIPAPDIPALQSFHPLTIDMLLGSTAGAVFKYCTSHGIIIEQKEFAAELDRIFKATAAYCEAYTRESSKELTFLHALKTDTDFRVEFLSRLKAKRDQVEETIVNQGVPSETDIREFLVCDTILHAYKKGLRRKQMFKEVEDPLTKEKKFEAIPFEPETLGAEANNQGAIHWLVTYFKYGLNPESAVDNPDKSTLRERAFNGPDFDHPNIIELDLRNLITNSVSRLRNRTEAYEPMQRRKMPDMAGPPDRQPRLKDIPPHPANDAAREVIDRVLPEPEITRRDFLNHTAKGAANGAVWGSVTAGSIHSIDGVHQKADTSGIALSDTLLGGAFVGAIAGALWHHCDKEAVIDKKKIAAEIDSVLSSTAALCIEEAKKPVRSAAR
ncbi:MAG: hypothetical protein U1E36_00295 [Rickettsiales bacterium]